MKSTGSLVLILTLMGASSVGAQASAGTRTEALSWMTGCWEGVRPNGLRLEEMWMPPRAGLLLGSARVTRPIRGTTRDTLVEFESVALMERRDSLFYIARPSGQPGAEFAADTIRERFVTFFNPAHDFPQRITYTARGDSMIATIQGPRNGEIRRITFGYARKSCGS